MNVNVKYNGYNTNFLTMPCNSDAQGKVVSVDSNAMAIVAVSENDFIGVCSTVKDGMALVQTSGYVEVPYDGEMRYGYTPLFASYNGKVCVNTSDTPRRSFPVIKIDTENKIVGFIL